MINRYLLGLFFKNFFAGFCLLAILIFILDTVELLRRGADLQNAVFSDFLLLGALRLPYVLESLIPFVVLISAMVTFYFLSKKSELQVLRSAGLSVWEILRGPSVAAASIGLVLITLYNPLSVNLFHKSQALESELFGARLAANVARENGIWARLESKDGEYILFTPATTPETEQSPLTLHAPLFYKLNSTGGFEEVLVAEKAALTNGAWVLSNVTENKSESDPVFFNTLTLDTALSSRTAQELFSGIRDYSFWRYPKLLATNALTPQAEMGFQFAIAKMASLPFLCVGMVFLAATVMLKHFRGMAIFPAVLRGLGFGLGLYFLLEISQDFGETGILQPVLMGLLPTFLSISLAVTILLYKEE